MFLASFASFFSKHRESELLQKIVEDGFDLFFRTRVIVYNNYESYNLGFVGSIAYHFRPILESVANKYGVKIVNVAKCPIDNLVKFHLEKHLA